MTTADTSSLIDRQRAFLAVMTSSMPTVPTEALLGYCADLMVGLDAGVSEWLNRRREAFLAAQALLVRTREARDLGALLTAQQEWALGAFRRAAADATMFHAAMIFVNHVNETFHEGVGQQSAPASATVTPMPPRHKPPGGKGPFRIQSS